MSNQQLQKEFVFKQVIQGTSKKNGRPYTMIELHDPSTLENSTFFIPDGKNVSTEGIILRDKVAASFEMDIQFGKPQLVLTALIKK